MSSVQESSAMPPRIPVPPPPRGTVRRLVYQREYKSALRMVRLKWIDPIAGSAPDSSNGATTPDRQTWKQWAGEKMKRSSSSQITTVEHVHLFPGWATRRYNDNDSQHDRAGAAPSREVGDSPFSLNVFVSGYATSRSDPKFRSRSERTVMRLAKAFAALPKLDESNSPYAASKTPSRFTSDELLHGKILPPRPDEIDARLQQLDEQLQHVASDSSSSESDSAGPTPISSPSRPSSPNAVMRDYQVRLQLQHDNLTERLRPFWCRTLSNRTVRLSVHVCSAEVAESGAEARAEDALSREPLYVEEVKTGPHGEFAATLTISNKLLHHPVAKPLLADDWSVEQELIIRAELFSKPPSPNSSSSSLSDKVPISPLSSPPTVVASTILPIHVSHSDVRLISDIDDTVKYSNILGGARVVFQNVFAKQLEDLVIKGMGEWYSAMWEKGVRFHYVSNSPFQLLPVINDFLEISRLPRGSIKLKSYTGFSLSNIFSAPASRKRDAINDLLTTFSDSRFLLVGDTGEQDLELYAECARKYPKQILAVFVRDASGDDVQPLDDPIGKMAHFLLQDPTGALSAKKAVSIPFGLPTFRSSSTTQLPDMPPPVRRRPSPAMSLPTTPIHEGDESDVITPTQSFNGVRLRAPVPVTPSKSRQSFREGISASRRPPLEKFRSASSPPFSLPTIGGQSQEMSPVMESPSSADARAIGMQRGSSFFGGEMTEAPENTTSTAGAGDTEPVIRPWLGNRSNTRSSTASTGSSTASLSPSERKRLDLQQRVWRARQLIPSEIPMRVFRDPLECVEAFQVLDKVQTEMDTKPKEPEGEIMTRGTCDA